MSDNTADSTGGIFNGGTLTLTNSTVSGNIHIDSRSSGGGINNQLTATIISSTISNNTSVAGGGIVNSGGATLTLTNSTVSGNTATGSFSGGGGGGIWNAGSLALTNSTISGNTADQGGGGIFQFHPSSTLILSNAIIANQASGGNCSGSGITSLGYNLDSDGTCNLTELTDVPNADPLMGPLAHNGGSTFTHALLPGSPAIDAGSPDCPPPDSDQRGVARPQGTACDLGAYEFEPATPTPTPTPTATPTPTPTAFKPGQVPLGGSGVFPDVPGAGGSSGADSIILAGIFAAVTVGALVLGGAAWYARRRLP